MMKIQCLAHIELSVTFDENNIPLRSLRNRKYKINGKCLSIYLYLSIYLSIYVSFYILIIIDDQLFGVPLSTLLQKDQRRDPKARIPLLIKEVTILINSIFQYSCLALLEVPLEC